MQHHLQHKIDDVDDTDSQPMRVQVPIISDQISNPPQPVRSPDEEAAPDQWKRRNNAWFLLMLFPPLLGLSFALPSYVAVWEVEIGEVNDGHGRVADTFARQLNHSLAIAIKDCENLMAFLEVGIPSEADFLNYVKYLESSKPAVDHRYREAMYWVPAIAHSERDSYEYEVAQTHPGFQFTEFTDQIIRRQNSSVYYPVRYIAQQSTAKDVSLSSGFDLGSIPKRLSELEKANEYVRTVGSSRIQIPDQQRWMYYIYTPVLHSHVIVGYIVGVYYFSDIIDKAFARLDSSLMVHVYDANDNDALIFSSSGSSKHDLANKKVRFRMVTLAMGEWHIYVQSTSTFDKKSHSDAPLWCAMIIGLGVSGISSVLFYMMATSLMAKERLSFTHKIVSKTASALSRLDLESVSFLDNLNTDDPTLASCRDIIRMVSDYTRFLPDMIRQETPTKTSEEPPSANFGFGVTPRVSLSPGMHKTKITLLRVSTPPEICESQPKISEFICKLHTVTREFQGRILNVQATTAQILFIGHHVEGLCKVWRKLRAYVTFGASITGAAMQGEAMLGIAGGDAQRIFVASGSLIDQLATLVVTAQLLGLPFLCNELFRNNAVPHESFSFVDTVLDIGSIYCMNAEQPGALGGSHGILNVNQRSWGQAAAISNLMRKRQWKEATMEIEKLRDEVRLPPVILHHKRRLEIRALSNPLCVHTVCVPPEA
eukprot:TRINITY_DN2221_c2_g1_i2.p1 TRINITY_DN2221_c2_g1~~TRINITY_DN2221_c2_g1_i2.p1  ORF type:complete len:710 (+),score=68.29 TRINITY_DN2221_c2_g1_i2:57-2186(+)